MHSLHAMKYDSDAFRVSRLGSFRTFGTGHVFTCKPASLLLVA